jgi:hypothetical protein
MEKPIDGKRTPVPNFSRAAFATDADARVFQTVHERRQTSITAAGFGQRLLSRP